MAELLYRLGYASARRAWAVVLCWLVVLVAAGGAYMTWGGTLSSAVTIPGTPTAQVTERLEKAFPEASGGTGTVVFSSTNGKALSAKQQAAISTALAKVAKVDGVRQTVDPFAVAQQREEQAAQVDAGAEQVDQARAQLTQAQAQLDAAKAQAVNAPAATKAALETQQAALDEAIAELDAEAAPLEQAKAQLEMAAEYRTISKDKSTAIATVGFDDPQMEITAETKEAVRNALAASPIDGVHVDTSAELADILPSVGYMEVIGIAVAAIVLIVMLGTLIAAGLPLLTALIGVGAAALGTLALSGSIEMVSATPILGVMLGLAVGIDYSLFILNRHRRQLREGMHLHESIALANGTSGNAVVFAGVTVIIALVALNVTGIPFLGLMGSVAAVSVAVAVLVAVTLTPALLGLAKMRVLPRRQRELAAEALKHPEPLNPPTNKTMSTPLAWLTIVGVILGVGVIALPGASMRLGLPDGSSEAQDSTQYQAFSKIEGAFGAGQNGALLAITDLPDGQSDEELAELQVDISTSLMSPKNVVAVVPIGTSDDKSLAAFQVIPKEGPNSESTEQLVHDLRALKVDGQPEIKVAVAGTTSGSIDISEKLADALPIYLVVVIGLSLIILVIVFRSILVPIVATGGFILSVFAAFGGVTAIFQWGWFANIFDVHDPGPILNFLPTLLVGILFGLAMDYQLFLVSGMRESYMHGAPARIAVVRGLHAGRAVVTAAAIIMASVFGGFVFSHLAMIRPIGFGLALGVLVDAFVVRMLLVPAVMHIAGDKAWWLPKWLERILPNVDIEGAALERRHHLELAPIDGPDGREVQRAKAESPGRGVTSAKQAQVARTGRPATPTKARKARSSSTATVKAAQAKVRTTTPQSPRGKATVATPTTAKGKVAVAKKGGATKPKPGSKGYQPPKSKSQRKKKR